MARWGILQTVPRENFRVTDTALQVSEFDTSGRIVVTNVTTCQREYVCASIRNCFVESVAVRVANRTAFSGEAWEDFPWVEISRSGAAPNAESIPGTRWWPHEIFLNTTPGPSASSIETTAVIAYTFNINREIPSGYRLLIRGLNSIPAVGVDAPEYHITAMVRLDEE